MERVLAPLFYDSITMHIYLNKQHKFQIHVSDKNIFGNGVSFSRPMHTRMLTQTHTQTWIKLEMCRWIKVTIAKTTTESEYIWSKISYSKPPKNFFFLKFMLKWTYSIRKHPKVLENTHFAHQKSFLVWNITSCSLVSRSNQNQQKELMWTNTWKKVTNFTFLDAILIVFEKTNQNLRILIMRHWKIFLV